MGLLFIPQYPASSPHYKCHACHTHISQKPHITSKECYVRINGESSRTPQMFLFFQNSMAAKTDDGELIALKDAIISKWHDLRVGGAFLVTYRMREAINTCEMDAQQKDCQCDTSSRRQRSSTHVLKELWCRNCSAKLGWRYVSVDGRQASSHYVFLRRKLVLSHAEDEERDEDNKMCTEVAEHPVLRRRNSALSDTEANQVADIVDSDYDVDPDEEEDYDEGEDAVEEDDEEDAGEDDENTEEAMIHRWANSISAQRDLRYARDSSRSQRRVTDEEDDFEEVEYDDFASDFDRYRRQHQLLHASTESLAEARRLAARARRHYM